MKQKAKILFYVRQNGAVSILLGKRTYGKEVFWWLPGGSVEEGEKPFEAVVRELYEELVPGPSIRSVVQGMLDTSAEAPFVDCQTPNARYRVFLVEVDVAARDEPTRILDEFDEVRWFDFSDLPSNMSREYAWLEPRLSAAL